MPTCSVKWCSYDSRKHNYKKDNITFHRFPKYPEMKSKWIDATARGDNWFPSKTSVICSRHFTEDNFCEMKQRRRLLDSALPTLYLPILSSVPIPVTPCPTSKIKTEDDGTSSSLHDTGTSAPENTPTNMNWSSIALPKSPSAYDCPVQKRLCRRINELERIVKRKNMLLKRFRDSKRRLKKKLALLKEQLDEKEEKEEKNTEEGKGGIIEIRVKMEPPQDPLATE